MRVIGGTARGRALAAFSGREIRPTPDRVREALFSILFSKRGPLAGCLVLDLFAGSGALGIEALSRGAAQAWFVEQSRPAVGTIRENLRRCGLDSRARVLQADVWQTLPVLRGEAPYALIFADPPYGRDDAPRLLQEIARYGLLAADGLLCLETAPTDAVPERCAPLQLLERRRYGSTMLHFYQSCAEEPA
jgi:16S rRNA (guanine(966)-N(2))-methyltransferase RsmD